MDPLSGGLIGSLLGGLFRLVPEGLKWLDRKDERAHELLMFQEAARREAAVGDQKLAEVRENRAGATDNGIIDAFKAAVESQTEMVKAAGQGWIASLSASVRPCITYLIIGIWCFLHLWFIFASGATATVAWGLIMTPDFLGIVGGLLNYWFLDRTLAKRGL